MTDYSLERASYTWQNALLWGNFLGHCRKATHGSLDKRVVHVIIAIIELFPLISQITSIIEKLIIHNFSNNIPRRIPLHKRFTEADFIIVFPNPLQTERTSSPISAAENTAVAPEQTSSGDVDSPLPTSEEQQPKVTETFEQKKMALLAKLPEKIASERSHKTYSRGQLALLNDSDRNLPIPLSSLTPRVKSFSKNTVFYSYNGEGIYDYGWGCAWRAIQTCLSAYKIEIPLENLFHLFGPQENLKAIYEDKYPKKKLSTSKRFPPYFRSDGWAEPFIGHMVMHFYNIPSTLEKVNGLPAGCSAPAEVFPDKHLSFSDFRTRLEQHFNNTDSAPVMIDDGIYTSNIVGIEIVESGRDESGTILLNTLLWIADPHISPGVNPRVSLNLSPGKSPVGLYKVILDNTGKQIDQLNGCSLYNDEDKHQVDHMFSKNSYGGIRFDRSKSWMVLFPN